MLPSQVNVTQARQLLPSLLHELERHPDRVFQILIRRRLAAELKAPPQISREGLAAERLLSLAKKWPGRSRRPSWRISEDTDRHLY